MKFHPNKPILALCILHFLFATAAYGQVLQVNVTDTEGNPLADSVVEVLLPESMQSHFIDSQAAVVDQRDKEFVPGVTIVTQGSQVSFPNSDDILHHVYSFSSAKTFNIPLYGSNENEDYFEVFDTPGVVEIGCNIHDWMLAYIYVAETRLATLSDGSGSASLDNLPTGEYRVRVWHPRSAGPMESLLHTVTLDGDTVATLNVELELQRERRVRRAPGSSGRRYR